MGGARVRRLNRQQIAIDLATELAELAEKDAAELRQLTAAHVRVEVLCKALLVIRDRAPLPPPS